MKRVWTEHLDNILRRNYASGDIAALAERLGKTRKAVMSRAKVLGLKRKNGRKTWSKRQLDTLRRLYADHSAEEISAKVKHPVRSVYQKAREIMLKKNPEFLAKMGRLVASTEGAKDNRFAKGHAPTKASASKISCRKRASRQAAAPDSRQGTDRTTPGRLAPSECMAMAMYGCAPRTVA